MLPSLPTATPTPHSNTGDYIGVFQRGAPQSYAGITAFTEATGVSPRVVLPRADSKGKSPRVLKLIRSLADCHGLDYLDLANAFDALEVDEFRISAWDKHPNVRGHRVIFEAIRDALRSRGQLPGFPPRPPDPERPRLSSRSDRPAIVPTPK